jgi:phospholipid/cholesterol/gamma-HCH transport system substrate-binding protein
MKEYTRNIIVGLTVLVALVILGVMIFVFAGLPGVFQGGQEFVVYMPSAAGVREGDPVHYADIRIGRVTNVSLADKSDLASGVTITFRVDPDVVVPDDVGLVINRGVMGPPWIALATMTEDELASIGPATDRTNGARILPGLQRASGPLAQFEPAMASLDEISENVRILSGNLIETSDHLSTLLITLNRSAEKLDAGTGTAGMLINDPALYQELLLVSRQLNEAILQYTELAKQWQEQGVEIQMK